MKKLFLLFLAIFSFQLMAITEKQKSDLVFMYQEEKLARDVYTYFSKIYDLKEKIKNSPDDIKFVYSNLLKGSENHKKAFTKW